MKLTLQEKKMLEAILKKAETSDSLPFLPEQELTVNRTINLSGDFKTSKQNVEVMPSWTADASIYKGLLQVALGRLNGTTIESLVKEFAGNQKAISKDVKSNKTVVEAAMKKFLPGSVKPNPVKLLPQSWNVRLVDKAVTPSIIVVNE